MFVIRGRFSGVCWSDHLQTTSLLLLSSSRAHSCASSRRKLDLFCHAWASDVKYVCVAGGLQKSLNFLAVLRDRVSIWNVNGPSSSLWMGLLRTLSLLYANAYTHTHLLILIQESIQSWYLSEWMWFVNIHSYAYLISRIDYFIENEVVNI